MGCVETRNSSEEAAVIAAERGLCFHVQQSTYVDFIIRKFSSNGTVNTAQLSRIADSLAISIYNSPPFTNIEDMFRKLINNEGQYDMKDLLIIGILLSVDQPIKKASLLFQIFDDDLLGKIPAKRFKDEILKKFTNICACILPMLVAPGQTPMTNTIKNEKYMSDMKQAQTIFINSLSDKLAVNGDFITENTFCEVLRTLSNGDLVFTTGWRKSLYETFVANPPKKTFANPYKKK